MSDNQFTTQGEAVLQLADRAAQRLGQKVVGSEHLLIGLTAEGSGVAARLLASFGLTEEKAVQKVEQLLGVDYFGKQVPIVGMTPRAKHILEMSFLAARQMGQTRIGTEHLLIALLKEPSCIAGRVLAECGIDGKKLYDYMMSSYDITDPTEVKQPEKVESKHKTAMLDKFSRNLTALAYEGKLDPIVGRQKEIQRVVQILSRKTKNNPCLIGEPGVGKTAIAEGLAQRIADGTLPDLFQNKQVHMLDLPAMVAGTKYRGEFEERLKNVLEEISKNGNIIVFIDELHTLIGAGAAEGAIDAANILKPVLARGELQVIGATTLEEYRKHIEKDAALERRFQPILVEQASAEETLSILKGIRTKFEQHHNIRISTQAMEAAVQLSTRYIQDRFLPDKAIDLMDEAASKLRLSTHVTPAALKKKELQIRRFEQAMDDAIADQDFEQAATLRDEVLRLKEEHRKDRIDWKQNQQHSGPELTAQDVAAVVSEWTGIPVTQMTQDESKRLLALEEELGKRVIGQQQAISLVAQAVRRGRVGLKDPKRPIGSFLFLGPTGVGKTELSKALANALFGSDDAMIRIDMSEYMEKFTVSRMIGSPPGYVGHEDGGQLTEKVRRKPYSILLFDEIEKAHPDVFHILLQILEDGVLTDAQGRKVNFKNTVIIMTSNVGAKEISERRRMGFREGDAKASFASLKADVMAELKRLFKPEFLNRVDDTVVFRPLTPEDIGSIAKNMLDELALRLAEIGLYASYSDQLLQFLVQEGYNEAYGARPLRRLIQNKLENVIAQQVLSGTLEKGDHVLFGYENDQLVWTKQPNSKTTKKAKAHSAQ